MNDRNHDEHPDFLRRRVLQAGAGAAALGSLAGAGILNANAQAPFDWKRYKGEKIEVFHVKSPRGDLLTKYHKEFEDLTGITVGSESAPEQQQRQKVVIEFNSGNTSFDVVEFAYAVQKRLLGKSNWLVDVRPLVADKSVTEPAFSFANLSTGGMEWATQPDGRIDSVPFNIDPWVLYYNKELFDASNVAYPRNFAEIVDAASPSKADEVIKMLLKAVDRLPLDSLRYGYAVWTEKKTGLVVKLQTLDAQGRVLEQSAFSELRLDVPVSMDKLSRMMAQTDGYQVEKPEMVKTTAAAQGWALGAAVPGFVSMNCFVRQLALAGAGSRPEATLQWIFSDGLASVSLFIEPYDPRRHVQVGHAVMGATSTLTQRKGDWWLTAVGEVPWQTLAVFAQGLERKK